MKKSIYFLLIMLFTKSVYSQDDSLAIKDATLEYSANFEYSNGKFNFYSSILNMDIGIDYQNGIAIWKINENKEIDWIEIEYKYSADALDKAFLITYKIDEETLLPFNIEKKLLPTYQNSIRFKTNDITHFSLITVPVIGIKVETTLQVFSIIIEYSNDLINNFSLYPNPATTSTTIESVNDALISSVVVRNKMGIEVVRIENLNTKSYNLSTASWQTDQYTVTIQSDKGIEQLHLSVEK